MDKAIIAVLVFMFAMIVFASYKDSIRYEKAEKFEQESGCEYIGRPRDLRSVAFYDCKGEIVMRRVK
jgi:hypothetical protein